MPRAPSPALRPPRRACAPLLVAAAMLAVAAPPVAGAPALYPVALSLSAVPGAWTPDPAAITLSLRNGSSATDPVTFAALFPGAALSDDAGAMAQRAVGVLSANTVVSPVTEVVMTSSAGGDWVLWSDLSVGDPLQPGVQYAPAAPNLAVLGSPGLVPGAMGPLARAQHNVSLVENPPRGNERCWLLVEPDGGSSEFVVLNVTVDDTVFSFVAATGESVVDVPALAGTVQRAALVGQSGRVEFNCPSLTGGRTRAFVPEPVYTYAATVRLGAAFDASTAEPELFSLTVSNAEASFSVPLPAALGSAQAGDIVSFELADQSVLVSPVTTLSIGVDPTATDSLLLDFVCVEDPVAAGWSRYAGVSAAVAGNGASESTTVGYAVSEVSMCAEIDSEIVRYDVALQFASASGSGVGAETRLFVALGAQDGAAVLPDPAVGGAGAVWWQLSTGNTAPDGSRAVATLAFPGAALPTLPTSLTIVSTSATDDVQIEWVSVVERATHRQISFVNSAGANLVGGSPLELTATYNYDIIFLVGFQAHAETGQESMVDLTITTVAGSNQTINLADADGLRKRGKERIFSFTIDADLFPVESFTFSYHEGYTDGFQIDRITLLAWHDLDSSYSSLLPRTLDGNGDTGFFEASGPLTVPAFPSEVPRHLYLVEAAVSADADSGYGAPEEPLMFLRDGTDTLYPNPVFGDHPLWFRGHVSHSVRDGDRFVAGLYVPGYPESDGPDKGLNSITMEQRPDDTAKFDSILVTTPWEGRIRFTDGVGPISNYETGQLTTKEYAYNVEVECFDWLGAGLTDSSLLTVEALGGGDGSTVVTLAVPADLSGIIPGETFTFSVYDSTLLASIEQIRVTLAGSGSDTLLGLRSVRVALPLDPKNEIYRALFHAPLDVDGTGPAGTILTTVTQDAYLDTDPDAPIGQLFEFAFDAVTTGLTGDSWLVARLQDAATTGFAPDATAFGGALAVLRSAESGPLLKGSSATIQTEILVPPGVDPVEYVGAVEFEVHSQDSEVFEPTTFSVTTPYGRTFYFDPEGATIDSTVTIYATVDYTATVALVPGALSAASPDPAANVTITLTAPTSAEVSTSVALADLAAAGGPFDTTFSANGGLFLTEIAQVAVALETAGAASLLWESIEVTCGGCAPLDATETYVAHNSELLDASALIVGPAVTSQTVAAARADGPAPTYRFEVAISSGGPATGGFLFAALEGTLPDGSAARYPASGSVLLHPASGPGGLASGTAYTVDVAFDGPALDLPTSLVLSCLDNGGSKSLLVDQVVVTTPRGSSYRFENGIETVLTPGQSMSLGATDYVYHVSIEIPSLPVSESGPEANFFLTLVGPQGTLQVSMDGFDFGQIGTSTSASLSSATLISPVTGVEVESFSRDSFLFTAMTVSDPLDATVTSYFTNTDFLDIDSGSPQGAVRPKVTRFATPTLPQGIELEITFVVSSAPGSGLSSGFVLLQLHGDDGAAWPARESGSGWLYFNRPTGTGAILDGSTVTNTLWVPGPASVASLQSLTVGTAYSDTFLFTSAVVTGPDGVVRTFVNTNGQVLSSPSPGTEIDSVTLDVQFRYDVDVELHAHPGARTSVGSDDLTLEISGTVASGASRTVSFSLADGGLYEDGVAQSFEFLHAVALTNITHIGVVAGAGASDPMAWKKISVRHPLDAGRSSHAWNHNLVGRSGTPHALRVVSSTVRPALAEEPRFVEFDVEMNAGAASYLFARLVMRSGVVLPDPSAGMTHAYLDQSATRLELAAPAWALGDDGELLDMDVDYIELYHPLEVTGAAVDSIVLTTASGKVARFDNNEEVALSSTLGAGLRDGQLRLLPTALYDLTIEVQDTVTAGTDWPQYHHLVFLGPRSGYYVSPTSFPSLSAPGSTGTFSEVSTAVSSPVLFMIHQGLSTDDLSWLTLTINDPGQTGVVNTWVNIDWIGGSDVISTEGANTRARHFYGPPQPFSTVFLFDFEFDVTLASSSGSGMSGVGEITARIEDELGRLLPGPQYTMSWGEVPFQIIDGSSGDSKSDGASFTARIKMPSTSPEFGPVKHLSIFVGATDGVRFEALSVRRPADNSEYPFAPDNGVLLDNSNSPVTYDFEPSYEVTFENYNLDFSGMSSPHLLFLTLSGPSGVTTFTLDGMPLSDDGTSTRTFSGGLRTVSPIEAVVLRTASTDGFLYRFLTIRDPVRSGVEYYVGNANGLDGNDDLIGRIVLVSDRVTSTSPVPSGTFSFVFDPPALGTFVIGVQMVREDGTFFPGTDVSEPDFRWLPLSRPGATLTTVLPGYTGDLFSSLVIGNGFSEQSIDISSVQVTTPSGNVLLFEDQVGTPLVGTDTGPLARRELVFTMEYDVTMRTGSISGAGASATNLPFLTMTIEGPPNEDGEPSSSFWFDFTFFSSSGISSGSTYNALVRSSTIVSPIHSITLATATGDGILPQTIDIVDPVTGTTYYFGNNVFLDGDTGNPYVQLVPSLKLYASTTPVPVHTYVMDMEPSDPSNQDFLVQLRDNLGNVVPPDDGNPFGGFVLTVNRPTSSPASITLEVAGGPAPEEVHVLHFVTYRTDGLRFPSVTVTAPGGGETVFDNPSSLRIDAPSLGVKDEIFLYANLDLDVTVEVSGQSLAGTAGSSLITVALHGLVPNVDEATATTASVTLSGLDLSTPGSTATGTATIANNQPVVSVHSMTMTSTSSDAVSWLRMSVTDPLDKSIVYHFGNCQWLGSADEWLVSGSVTRTAYAFAVPLQTYSVVTEVGSGASDGSTHAALLRLTNDAGATLPDAQFCDAVVMEGQGGTFDVGESSAASVVLPGFAALDALALVEVGSQRDTDPLGIDGLEITTPGGTVYDFDIAGDGLAREILAIQDLQTPGFTGYEAPHKYVVAVELYESGEGRTADSSAVWLTLADDAGNNVTRSLGVLDLNRYGPAGTYAIHDPVLVSPVATISIANSGADSVMIKSVVVDETYYIASTEMLGTSSANPFGEAVLSQTLEAETVPIEFFTYTLSVQVSSDSNAGLGRNGEFAIRLRDAFGVELPGPGYGRPYMPVDDVDDVISSGQLVTMTVTMPGERVIEELATLTVANYRSDTFKFDTIAVTTPSGQTFVFANEGNVVLASSDPGNAAAVAVLTLAPLSADAVAELTADVATRCASSQIGLDTNLIDGESSFKFKTRDSDVALSSKFSVLLNGDVAVANRLVLQGGVQPRYLALVESRPTEAGDHLLVSGCGSTVTLPAGPINGDYVEILATVGGPACRVAIETHPAWPAMIDGWPSAFEDLDIRVTEPGLVRFTYAGAAAGWVSSSPGALVRPVGELCVTFAQYQSGLEDGEYMIDPTGSDMFGVYCAMSQGGWTMVQSLALASTLARQVSLDFALNMPLNNDFGPAGHLDEWRLSKARMAAVQARTTRARVTCNRALGAGDNHMLFDHGDVNILAFSSTGGTCATALSVVVENGAGACTDCPVLLLQDAFGLHTNDMSATSCPSDLAFSTAEASVSWFGYYAVRDREVGGCAGAGDGTTEWWMM